MINYFENESQRKFEKTWLPGEALKELEEKAQRKEAAYRQREDMHTIKSTWDDILDAEDYETLKRILSRPTLTISQRHYAQRLADKLGYDYDKRSGTDWGNDPHEERE